MRSTLCVICRCGAVAAAVVLGCSGIERTTAPPRPSGSVRASPADIPQVMRGTVASEAILDGFRPVPIFGNGLVVGLQGTGSRDVPPAVRAFLMQAAERSGIGRHSSGWGDLSPEALIDSPDTAVVIVEGVIPAGAAAGTTFDVAVFPYPSSSTASLEGGRLYTTDLLPRSNPDGTQELLPPTGSKQPAALATASGPVFLNPFAEPGSTERDTINRLSGRVLDGGIVTRDMPLKLRLRSPSHTRAMILQDAINTRFPREPGARDQTARGESDESIAISVPPSFHGRSEEFLELLRHTTVQQANAEQVAMTVRRHLLSNPSAAEHASWRWRALGARALPAIRDLYDYPEEMPRMAALRAGAKLDDPLVSPHLIRMATTGSREARLESIELLGGMGIDPVVDQSLRRILDDEDLTLRLAAYEALLIRNDASVTRLPVDGKFVVDVVESRHPMVYVTLRGLPTLTIFGRDLAIDRPATVTAWSQQFMIKADAGDEGVEVYFRPDDSTRGTIHKVEPGLLALVRFLGHETEIERPEPGLGLSYGEVVGLVHQIWRQGYLDADFKAEQDPILAAMMRTEPRLTPTQRPEFDPQEPAEDPAPAQGPQAERSRATPGQ